MNNREYQSVFSADSSETIAYNNPLFPVYVRYGKLSFYPDYSAISHWHRDLEFIFIKKGKMTYSVNGEQIELPENSGIMVNSRQMHYGFSIKKEECEFICILLSPELLEGNQWFYQNYIECIVGNNACPYLYLDRNSWKGAVLEKLEEIYDFFNSACIEADSYFKLIEDFLSIMRILYVNLDWKNQTLTKESFELEVVRDMVTYIEEHFTEQITLLDLALVGACCKSKCSFLFRKYLHDTPIVYITKLRLRKSLTALLNSDVCITDIAYEYGFCGASYYCKTFRKYYGLSPFQYRKMRSLAE